MPKYELCLITRCLERLKMVQALKRATSLILEEGGIVRSYENLGERDLPYRMVKHGQHHTKGNFFLIHFDSSAAGLSEVQSNLRREEDIIRARVLRREVEVGRPCQHGTCDFGEMNDEMRTRLRQQLKTFVQKQ